MNFRGDYAFLSNMYTCVVKYNGMTFPCVETAFQYQKCELQHDRDMFVNGFGDWIGGFTARKLGKRVKLRSDWEDVKTSIMYELLESKFRDNDNLKKALLATDDMFIAEDNDWGDTFWGVYRGEGQNMLGKMIMEIRETLRQEEPKELKVIVAGSRSFNDYKLLKEKLNFYFQKVSPVIVCGEARGADSLGRKYAEECGYAILSFPADWEHKGKSAGYIRNEQMAEHADALVAFWDGKSKGTEHMINTMKKMKKPVKVVKFA